MKTIIRAGLLISGICLVPFVHAGGESMYGWGLSPDARFYGGASLGAANQNGFDDGTNVAGKLFAGVRYHQLGAEVGYARLGEAETEGDMPRDLSFKSETSGLFAAAVGYLPVSYRAEAFGKLGAMYWDSEQSESVDLTGVKSDSDDSGFSPLLGLGAQYQLTQNLNLRGEWERILSTGSDEFESDVDLLSLGVSLSTY